MEEEVDQSMFLPTLALLRKRSKAKRQQAA